MRSPSLPLSIPLFFSRALPVSLLTKRVTHDRYRRKLCVYDAYYAFITKRHWTATRVLAAPLLLTPSHHWFRSIPQRKYIGSSSSTLLPVIYNAIRARTCVCVAWDTREIMITFINNNVLIRDKVAEWKSLRKAKGSHFPIDKKKNSNDRRANGQSFDAGHA